MPASRSAARATYPIVTEEWGARELAAVARALCTPWRAARRESRLTRGLLDRLEGAHVLPVNAGRSALRRALEVFRRHRPGRERVLVPAYVCPSVIDAVVEAGCRPVPVDVGADLNLSIAALRTAATEPDVLAIVAVHMYGAPAAIEAIEDVGRSSGVFVIDDAAQVLGVRVNDRPLGTFGDVGVLSFAQSKTIVTGVRGSGGALVVRDAELASELLDSARAWPRARHRWHHLTRFALTRRGGRVGRSLAWRMTERFADDYDPARISGVDAALALAQLDHVEDRIAGRVRCCDAFADRLRRSPGVVMPQAATGRYLTRVLVQLPADVDRTEARRQLEAAGVHTRLPYDLAPVERHGPAAPIGARLLELPSHSHMGTAAITDICDELDSVLERLGATKNSLSPNGHQD